MRLPAPARRSLLAVLAGSALAAQQPQYFKEEKTPWWKPKAELEIVHDRTEFDPYARKPIERTLSRLRLRWEVGTDSDWWQLRAGSAHRAGSDGNRNNLARFDNETSSGSNLDLAELRLRALSAQGGAELHAGLGENGLLTQESLFDPDLRILGVGGRAFWRHEASGLEELGLRGESGKIQLIHGGEVKLTAFQGVLRFATGPITWTVHGGPWKLEARQQDAAAFRRQNPAGVGGSYPNPTFRFDTLGAGLLWGGDIPLELKALRHKNKDTGERGEELQVWLGSSTRPYWPRVGYIRQLLPATGALASINGDLWWHHANADGERYVVQLPLPQKWTLSFTRVDQRRRGVAPPATVGFKRSMVGLSKRF
ncbi:MAG: hypothetical protein IPL96_16180 [Holophagaceae bacterium]|nr:hypothetical protein [Holophagaceae bacterium]